MQHRRVRLWSLGFALAMGCLFATVSQANPITVAAGEVAVANNGVCSLREAIHNANADAQVDNTDCAIGSGPDVIGLAAGSTYTLLDEDDPGSGLPAIASEIVIDGNGATIERSSALMCTLDGTQTADEFRIVTVFGPGVLTLNDLTLRNGCADGSRNSNDGGGIKVADSASFLTLNRVTVTGNGAWDKSGGLDITSSTVDVVDSSFTYNFAAGGAGAIGNGGGVLTIEGSTIAFNSATGQGGGGIGNLGTMTMVNSTVSNNTDTGTTGGGGGIGNLGSAEVVHSTVWGNSSSGPFGGGGIGNGGDIQIKNSIVGGSTAGGDCSNLTTFNALGDNFDTDGTCAGIDADFTQVTAGQLALAALANNGGPTQTQALIAGSVAIDAVTDCTLIDGTTPVTVDQRGITRPKGASCDAGAFEAEAISVVEIPTLGLGGVLLDALVLLGLGLWWLRR
jgi:hypothetical protein